MNHSLFDEILNKMVTNSSVFGAILCIENLDRSISWRGAAGDLEADDHYFIASVTKMIISTLILHLREKNKLGLDDPIVNYFPEGMLDGIHLYKGTDYTKVITIKHLLSNTSGIPDYFSSKKTDGTKIEAEIFGGSDEFWSLDMVIDTVKKMKPKFRPGQKGKVAYSDTNFRLLGAIIEKVTGKDLRDVFKEYIFSPAGMENSYAFHDVDDDKPASMYYKKEQIHIPKFVASCTAEGGVVSTAEDVMKLNKAYFNSLWFPEKRIEELKEWKMIYFPGQFYFGIGLEKLWTPRFISPLRPINEILGFWGQSGAFAFHHPGTGLYFTGTVNQLSGFGHSAAYNAMVKIIKTALKEQS
ncbi:MAG: class C beta-lactamase-related serine hydrolase [Balneolaceae bacterium]|nr:MAG: class C beta-lactamase-related serine hydrolase [Balneolaceae bacterium]